MDWYDSLKQSPLTPPKKTFGIVWPILYTMILISFILFLQQDGIHQYIALTFFIIQLILNLSWSSVFFTAKQLLASCIIISLLLVSIIGVMITFYKVNPVSTYLLIPYVIWVSFATYLNIYIYIYN